MDFFFQGLPKTSPGFTNFRIKEGKDFHKIKNMKIRPTTYRINELEYFEKCVPKIRQNINILMNVISRILLIL